MHSIQYIYIGKLKVSPITLIPNSIYNSEKIYLLYIPSLRFEMENTSQYTCSIYTKFKNHLK